MAKKKPYDEVGVLRTLRNNRGISFGKDGIEVDNNSGQVGNGTWGKIDYLVKVHGYTYTCLTSSEKRANSKNYAPRIINPNKEEKQITTNVHPAKAIKAGMKSGINLANMTKIAMKNSLAS